MDGEFRRYLAYALGELVLVVLGILIALQIDTWNDERKQAASLQASLEVIAGNMREDRSELQSLRKQRFRTLEAGVVYPYLLTRNEFSVAELNAATLALGLASEELFFSANSSGYDALKGSDSVKLLQGSGIDSLLSKYYDTVRRIELLEQSHADYIRELNLELTRLNYAENQRLGVTPEFFAFSNPEALSAERFAELQPIFRAMVHSDVWGSLVMASSRVQNIVMLYDSLNDLSRELDTALSGETWAPIESLPPTSIDRWLAGEGQPVLVENGRVPHEQFMLMAATSGINNSAPVFMLDSMQQLGDELRVRHAGGTEWVAIFLMTARNRESEISRSGLDYSRFSKLEIELKGDRGGESVSVSVKDNEYPDDLPPISVPLTLDSDWRTYEIDLGDFAPNDISRLHIPLSFIFAPAHEPVSLSVRNARFR